MYLINTATLKLERFDDEARTPRYAILSHTWGDTEVTFEDIHGDWSNRGLGAWKVQRTCEQAVQDDLQYAWVDTCCIDKRSSAELSEAINSMFKWYQRAAVCYAYLEDVNDVEGLSTARWFTRGWTLQELIAPRMVLFYGANWNLLGQKVHLSDTLSAITGINEVILKGLERLEDISIAQRMSWAARRTTTRIEDLAYCLLGIFDISMVLLYGEGEKAFMRLQQEILKDNNEQSLFAWTPSHAQPNDEYGMLSFRGRSSAFAYHPREFEQSSLISSGGQDAPFELTNAGVSIRVAVLPLEPANDWASGSSKGTFTWRGTILLVLDCFYTSGVNRLKRVAICCECINTDGLLIVQRRRPDRLYAITETEYQQARWEDVYIVKRMVE